MKHNAHTTRFAGFSRPDSNFFRLPNEWTNITAALTSFAEIKVIEYVLKHTWGYSEFDMVKKITTDEFMHGRKNRRGERIDAGTGLSNKSVIDGLSRAIEHGYLLVEVDDADKARIKKLYKLNMSEPIEADGVAVNNGKSDVKNLHSEVNELHSCYEASPHRSEEEKRVRYNNVLNVVTHRTQGTNGKSREEVAYFANAIAEKLGDQKSLTYYKLVCSRYDPHQLLQKAAEIVGDGAARNPGAVFAAWAKSLSQKEQPYEGNRSLRVGT